MEIVIIIIVAIPVILFYLYIRNEWVYKTRIGIINSNDYKYYDKLPGYSEMVLKYFWIWSAKKFIEQAKKSK